MKANVGGMDRAVRIIVGLLLIVLSIAGVIGWWGWIGLVPLLTGLFRSCPLYLLFGWNTCPLTSGKPGQEK